MARGTGTGHQAHFFEASAMARDLATLLPEAPILSGEAASRAYDCDAYTVDKSRPTAIVLPSTNEEVLALVQWCLRQSVPYTARGAGTGLSGGALPALGGVVIGTRRMNRILRVEPEHRTMRAQAGVTNRALSQAAEPYGLHFAPDPSSGSVSTLGGNIAENAGGPHTLKYGVTSGHVLAVGMVTTDGELEEFGSEVAGSPGLDFLGLIVGGEGTLGIVTEATVKLTPLPKFIVTALIAFSSVRAASESVAAIIASGVIPAALEMMDQGILAALQAGFGLTFAPNSQALLLVECDGAKEAHVTHEMEVVQQICGRLGSIEIQIASDEKGRKKLWKARKQGVGAMGRLAPTVVTHDGVIPRSKLPEMLETVYLVAAEFGIGVANIFHAGDGNLHPCFYFDERVPGAVERVVAAGEILMRRCVELGGSITGEHGIGVEKLDLMSLMFSPNDLSLQADCKRIFNDGVLCNPCKVLPNQKSCVEHKSRWRGAAW